MPRQNNLAYCASKLNSVPVVEDGVKREGVIL